MTFFSRKKKLVEWRLARKLVFPASAFLGCWQIDAACSSLSVDSDGFNLVVALHPTIMEVENRSLPRLVSFKLGKCSTSMMMGERVNREPAWWCFVGTTESWYSENMFQIYRFSCMSIYIYIYLYIVIFNHMNHISHIFHSWSCT